MRVDQRDDVNEVIKRVWPDEAEDVGTQMLREELVAVACDICHETGDRESWLRFVAAVVHEFMDHPRRGEP